MPVIEVDGTSGTLALGGPGVAVLLNDVIVGTGAASAVCTVYKGTSASGTKIATIDATAANMFEIDTTVLGGVFVTVTGGAAKCSISFD